MKDYLVTETTSVLARVGQYFNIIVGNAILWFAILSTTAILKIPQYHLCNIIVFSIVITGLKQDILIVKLQTEVLTATYAVVAYECLTLEYCRAHNNALNSNFTTYFVSIPDMAIIAIIARALNCNNRKQKTSVPPNPTLYKL